MKRSASRLHIQFIWLCTLLTFLIVCTWLILYSAMTHILQAQARDRVDSLIEQVAYNISVKAKLIEFYADTILKNQYTQRMLLEKNPYANYFNVQNFRKTVSTYTENNEELGSLFILNDKDVFLSINPVPSFYSVLAQLNREYTLFDMDGVGRAIPDRCTTQRTASPITHTFSPSTTSVTALYRSAKSGRLFS